MPRILWLYQYAPDYNFDSFFHLDYVRWMKNNGYEINAYGPRVHDIYRDICLVEYLPTRTLKDIYEKFQFDIIIANTKSRLFYDYHPREDSGNNCWLPKDFKEYNCPKVMIEEDFQYEDNDNWYREMGFNLMLQRHYSNSLLKHTIPVKFFPFSVDTKIFHPVVDLPRANKIAFLGHKSHEIYVDRRWACDKLTQANLLADYSEQRIKEGGEYPIMLRKYDVALCGSGIYHLTHAKLFEIMACGTVLFTDRHAGYALDKLFPEDSYFTYHPDCFDVVEKAQYLLNNQDLMNKLSQNGVNCIKNSHTHKIRTEQLMEIIKCL